MGLFGNMFGKSESKAAESNTQNMPKKIAHSTEQLDMVIGHLRRKTAKLSLTLETGPSKQATLTGSKIGGFPYWPADRLYPKTLAGEKLVLLAQINFAEVVEKSKPLAEGVQLLNQATAQLSSPLPSKGLLQFFILPNDLYGMDFDDQTKQDTFRVVYHPEIDETLTWQDSKAAGALANTMLDPDVDEFPCYEEFSLRFYQDVSCVNYTCEDYCSQIEEAFAELFGEHFDEPVFRALDKGEYDYLAKALDGANHRMLGYPFFTQADPRSTMAPGQFDTLLLQIDSEFEDIVWGDSGVCNFFIAEEDLRACNFDRVLYNWDCF